MLDIHEIKTSEFFISMKIQVIQPEFVKNPLYKKKNITHEKPLIREKAFSTRFCFIVMELTLFFSFHRNCLIFLLKLAGIMFSKGFSVI
jgi:hypothetical protein